MRSDANPDMMTVEAELRVPSATARLARFHIDGADYVYHDDSVYWLDLALTPRANLRGRYLEAWKPHHFKRAGGVLCLPPGHACEFKTEAGSVASVVCELGPDLFRNWFESDLEWTSERLEAALDVPNPKVRTLLLWLAGEMRQPSMGSEALAELMIGQIAIELGRHYAAAGTPRRTGGLASWRLRIIDEKLAEVGPAPTLSELAELCQLSVRQLTRGFRASRGCTLGAYIAQSRTDIAKRQLATDQPIQAIAHAMGFSCPSSFSYAFRQATGMSPRQFRRSLLPSRPVSH